MGKVDDALRELERQRANKKEAEHQAKLKARQNRKADENKLLWARHYNTLAKHHASQARRYEALCDELLPIGDE